MNACINVTVIKQCVQDCVCKHKSARIAFEDVYASNDLTLRTAAANVASVKTVFTHVYKECK
jgi:hypothetical protein